MRERGPSNFDVMDRLTDTSHGIYDTLEEARGCVEYDRLLDWEIWQGDHIAAEGRSDFGNLQCAHVVEYGEHAWTNDSDKSMHCVECGLVNQRPRD
jgi:hypothetical protein